MKEVTNYVSLPHKFHSIISAVFTRDFIKLMKDMEKGVYLF